MLKEKYDSFKTDKLMLAVWVLSLGLSLLFAVHLFLVDKSSMRCVVNFLYFLSLTLGSFFFGRNAFYILTNIFALVLLFVTDFSCFVSIWLVLLASHIKHDKEKIWLCFYIVCATISFTIQKAEVLHIIIHFLICLFFLVSHYFLCDNKHIEKLVLTFDEKKILDELAQGKQQKEITFFCQNTITNKLRAAKDRNNIKDSHELIRRYKESVINHKDDL